jgi:glycosyltransferase involved in cell wall biosynthesis
MKLSFIIPNYNSEKTILKTIKSIYDPKIKQKYEIIVVDDHSNDNSVKLIKETYQDVKLIQNNDVYGASFTRNQGIKKSKGEILIFIDSDAWFNKKSIELLVNNINDFDIVFPKTIFENKKTFYPEFDNEKKYPHISVCFAIKRDSLSKLDNLFDIYYSTYLEDYDFFIRCNLSKLNAKYVEKSIITHINKDNIGDQKLRYYLEVRNTLYGIKKFRKVKELAKKTQVKNPFTYFNLLKLFIFGVFNFAWFNWYKYDRTKKGLSKLKILFQNNNKITKYGFILPFIFFRAVIGHFQNKKKTTQTHIQ